MAAMDGNTAQRREGGLHDYPPRWRGMRKKADRVTGKMEGRGFVPPSVNLAIVCDEGILSQQGRLDAYRVF